MNQPQTGKGVATSSQLVAWEVEINYMSCVVFAATKAKAKWTAVKSYWEAYGKNGSWPHCSIARRPAHDSYPGEPGRAYSTSYIRG
jgi:hypothetical protein